MFSEGQLSSQLAYVEETVQRLRAASPTIPPELYEYKMVELEREKEELLLREKRGIAL